MRFRKSFLNKKIKQAVLLLAFCVFGAALVFGGVRIFAEILGDDVRVNEDEDLTYYISVNSDGIDYTGAESSDSITVEEVSGVTVVKDVIPDGLSFVDFVTSSDGTFGAVQRDDKVTACSGKVIDDTNEESVDSGVWNNETNEYTYHGLHYDANTRTVSFKTKGIGAGCELTIGVITHTPTLAENEFRKDFYNTASFVDESLTDKSNTVHAYIQKQGSVLPGEYSVSYRYDGVVPDGAPSLPSTEYFDDAHAEFTLADTPSVDGYEFTGWLWDAPASGSSSTGTIGLPASALNGHLPGFNVEFYGSFKNSTISEDTPQPGDDYYSLRYRYDNRAPAGAPALPATEWHKAGDAITIANKPEVDCYSFNGWNWTPQGAPATYIITDPASAFNGRMIGQNIVLFGSFTYTCEGEEPVPDLTPEKYNVSYAIDGEKPESFDLPASRNYLEGASVELDSTKEGENFDGYDFSGWDTESEEIEVDSSLYFTMPKRNVVLRGSFDREEYTVSYEFSSDVKPENYESLLPATESYFAGDNVTVAAVPVADGYSFSGWYADPSFEMPAKNVVIYGEWIKDKQEFTPEISISIKNPENEYHVGDTVEFEVVVKNTTDFDMVDVWLEELLDGAVFAPGEGYEVTEQSFVKIANIPANGEAHVDAQFEVTKNMTKLYTNTVEMIAGSSANEDYALPEDWNSKASVDFATAAVEDLPVDEDTEVPEEKESPKTFDGVLKFVISGGIISGGLCAAVIVFKKNRRGTYRYAFSAAVVVIAGFAVVLMNGGGSFADSLAEKPSLDIFSSKANFANNDAGAWKVTESGSWTGVGEAMLNIEVDTKRISDLNNKDVILVLDNSDWSASAIDGTRVDSESQLTTMQIMKNGAMEFAEQLLEKDNSRLLVFPTWGSINMGFSDDMGEIESAINRIEPKIYTNRGSYGETYNKLISLVDGYEGAEDRSLTIIYVSDDHYSRSDDVAKYRILKSKVPNATVAGIGIGIKELLNERYTSGWSAKDNQVARYWVGVDGNAHEIGWYSRAVEGLDLISDWHDNPVVDDYVGSLIRATDSSLVYDRFNLDTTINLDDFEIRGIFGNDGDIEVHENIISWKNEDKPFVSGQKYKMSVLLKAKDDSVEKHKLYRLNAGTRIDTEARDIEADYVESNDGVVLMNGYELKFDINNSSTCSLGNNNGGIYLAYQKISLSEEGVACEGWNFDSFRDPDDGTIYGAKFNQMPAKDITLNATWRKTSVVIRMEGEIYTTAPAVLASGEVFNNKAYAITSSVRYYSRVLLKSDSCPKSIIDDSHRISDDNSATPIYLYIDPVESFEYINPYTGDDGYYYSYPTYYCSDSDDIILNEDSSHMFSNSSYYDDNGTFHNIRSTWSMLSDDVGEWDASNVKNFDGAFAGSDLELKAFDVISNWDVSSVESMNETFSSLSLDSYNNQPVQFDLNEVLAGWDTSNVKSMKKTFSGSAALTKIPGIKEWNVSNVTDMEEIFRDTTFTSGVDLNSWDVSNVQNIRMGFYDAAGDNLNAVKNWKLSSAESLEYVFGDSAFADYGGLYDWDVSNVKNFSEAFQRSSITNADVLSQWDVSSAETLSGMFYGSSLESVEALSAWNVSNVKNMDALFAYTKIASLRGLNNWKVSNVESMRSIFARTLLENLSGVEEWDVSRVEDLSSFIAGNERLVDLSALSDWETGNNKSLASAFLGVPVDDLTALSGWNTSSLEDLSRAFCGEAISISGYATLYTECDSSATEWILGGRRVPYMSVKSLNGVQDWDVSHVTNMSGMVAGSLITDLTPLSEWSVGAVVNMNSIFASTYIEDLSPLANWRPSSVESMRYSFFNMTKLKNLSGLEDWRTPNLEDLFSTFSYMDSLENIEALANWDVSGIDTLLSTFALNKKLTSLHGLENWDVSHVIAMTDTFRAYSTYTPAQYTDWSKYYCQSSLTDISALSSWDTSSLTGMTRAFACNNELTSLSSLRSWDVDHVMSFNSAFEGVSKVTSLDGLQGWGVDSEVSCPVYDNLFMNMLELSDISALSDWNTCASVRNMFRNDSKITDLSPLNNMRSSSDNGKANAFDGIPTSVARPTWY